MSGIERMRPDASAQKRAEARSGPSPRERTCRECGAAYAALRAHSGFCSKRCRAAFNRRRAQRGAVLYDLYMVHRHRRSLAGKLRVLFHMNRLAAHWLAEDEAKRGGRESWRNPRDVLRELAWLRADVLKQVARR